MKKILVLFFIGITNLIIAQQSELANSYFEKGEFEKAVTFYEDFYKKSPFAQVNYPRLITCYQELKQYDKAQKIIENRIEQYNQYQCYVDLGYNFQLQNKTDLANKSYEKAISLINENQNMVYGIAREFENKVQIDYAIKSYELASKLYENLNFDYQLSLLYGQKGDFDKMISKILDYAYNNQNSVFMIQNMLVRYMNDDANGNFTNQLRKSLLTRIQNNQDIFWSKFLSWYFVQQRDYAKAFIHEKAIFKREGTNIKDLISLAKAAFQESETELTFQISDFVLENVADQEIQLKVTILKNEVALKTAIPQNYSDIKKQFDLQIQNFGISRNSDELVLQAASFDGFQLNNFNDAKLKIDALLKLSLSKFSLAKVKDLLADLYLSNEKFNQAIVYYAQIQDDLSNNEFGHEAQFKMARASYFKTDFDWAQKQFKVLKQSTSLLIANDALEMYLLINDVTEQDSTKVSLTKFAKADFLKFKKKNNEAKAAYLDILKQHAGENIEDVTLFRLAEVNTDLNLTNEAIINLENLINNFPESIYLDDAYYHLGNAYEKLENIDKAKANFEKIIENHQDSIYFLEAQIKFRKLRGDKNI